MLNFPTSKSFRMNNTMKLVHQYMVIFGTFSPTSSHLDPLQVENCDSNSRTCSGWRSECKGRIESIKTNSVACQDVIESIRREMIEHLDGTHGVDFAREPNVSMLQNITFNILTDVCSTYSVIWIPWFKYSHTVDVIVKMNDCLLQSAKGSITSNHDLV